MTANQEDTKASFGGTVSRKKGGREQEGVRGGAVGGTWGVMIDHLLRN